VGIVVVRAISRQCSHVSVTARRIVAAATLSGGGRIAFEKAALANSWRCVLVTNVKNARLRA